MPEPDIPNLLQRLAAELGGKVTEVSGPLPDGSGFATMSLPLPKDHWLTTDQDGFNVPPMPMRIGTSEHEERDRLAGQIRAAARYAIRCSTRNGQEIDFDPDAMVQNFVVGLLGYWTPTGLSEDEWANPRPAAP